MTLLAPSQTPDRPEAPPLPPELEKAGDLNGIQEIITHLQRGEWAPMVGAIMSMWKEYFGTPEEKAEIMRARKERKDAQTQKDTRSGLSTLHSAVDRTRESKEGEKAQTSEDGEVVPYRPGTKEPHVSPKGTFRNQIEQIYAREDTLFTVNNLHEYFGKDYKKFLIQKDPFTGEQPITFLGRPILGGVSLAMITSLRIVERILMDRDINYVPKEKEVRGFQDRNMCVGNQNGQPILDPNIPSFHKYGLAVDLDPDFNWPKDGRGTIPDEVLVAMAEAGLAVGNVAGPTFEYLMNDTMHCQMRFPPESAAGQKIINASPVGRRYWKKVSPMLEAIRGGIA